MTPSPSWTAHSSVYSFLLWRNFSSCPTWTSPGTAWDAQIKLRNVAWLSLKHHQGRRQITECKHTTFSCSFWILLGQSVCRVSGSPGCRKGLELQQEQPFLISVMYSEAPCLSRVMQMIWGTSRSLSYSSSAGEGGKKRCFPNIWDGCRMNPIEDSL